MISEENKEFFDVLPLNERLLFLCLSKYTKCDVNDDIKEYQQLSPNIKECQQIIKNINKCQRISTNSEE